MPKTIFGRMVAVCLVVVLVSLLILSGALVVLLQRYVFAERAATLQRFGQEAADLVVRASRGEAGRRELLLGLRTVAALSGARVTVVDREGRPLDEALLPRVGVSTRIWSRDLERALQGEVAVSRGVAAGSDLSVLSVAVPIRDDGGILGAVLLHAPVAGIRLGARALYRLVWLAGLCSAAVAVLMAYLLSRRLSRPLHRLGELARRLASGDFRIRAEVADGGEVAQLAASFNYMAEQLGRLEQMRREFVASVSHELRSPLTSIRGFVQGVLDGTVPPDRQQHYLSLALSECGRLGRLIDELLDLAALEAGSGSLSLGRVDLRAVAGEAVAQMQPQAQARGVELRCEPGPEPTSVKADADRVKQVVINLLDNGIRFTPEGGRVRVAVRLLPSWGELEVSDTGPGIPAEELPHIWERFYKADKARTRSRGGTGLGLAIVKRLVEAHGGTVSAESEVGRGTTFRVRLPRWSERS
ncbi:MAG: HAMP domain-containing histidine kinase [Acetobacteraceae bacterium]|nr:HAMP domain-containing histidine kinase [Acetobacteraceae bacterium]